MKTVLNSIQITEGTTLPELTNISSFSVTNYDLYDMYLKVNGVERVVPGWDSTVYKLPIGCFSMDGDGSVTDIQIEFRFTSPKGTGNVIFDYRKLKEEEQNNHICNV